MVVGYKVAVRIGLGRRLGGSVVHVHVRMCDGHAAKERRGVGGKGQRKVQPVCAAVSGHMQRGRSELSSSAMPWPSHR